MSVSSILYVVALFTLILGLFGALGVVGISWVPCLIVGVVCLVVGALVRGRV